MSAGRSQPSVRPARFRLRVGDVVASLLGGATMALVLALEIHSAWLGLGAAWACATMAGVGAWDGGSTRAWRKLRKEVLLRNRRLNGGRCTLQLPGVCAGRADCAHHLLGRGVTGDDPRYVVAACTACNLKVGKPAAARAADPAPIVRTQW